MHLIDHIFTEDPSFGSRRIEAVLKRHGLIVNRKRVIRIMHKMGIQAIYPKKKQTTISDPQHHKYPYLLRGMKSFRRNQVWATDITYVRMRKGFLYLTAILDWHSRYVLSWELSNTLDTFFCIDALEEALAKYQKPEIFNSDQGCQYTSNLFSQRLIDAKIQISMASTGRCYDNIFTERLWRTVKQEEIYIKEYENGLEARTSLNRYFQRYNKLRPHQALGYKTPEEVYLGTSTYEQFLAGDLMLRGSLNPKASQAAA